MEMILTGFSWQTLAITFGVIGAYLIGLGIFVLIKRAVMKKKLDKEKKEHEEKDK